MRCSCLHDDLTPYQQQRFCCHKCRLPAGGMLQSSASTPPAATAGTIWPQARTTCPRTARAACSAAASLCRSPTGGERRCWVGRRQCSFHNVVKCERAAEVEAGYVTQGSSAVAPLTACERQQAADCWLATWCLFVCLFLVQAQPGDVARRVAVRAPGPRRPPSPGGHRAGRVRSRRQTQLCGRCHPARHQDTGRSLPGFHAICITRLVALSVEHNSTEQQCRQPAVQRQGRGP